jgi:hypothetical protein
MCSLLIEKFETPAGHDLSRELRQLKNSFFRSAFDKIIRSSRLSHYPRQIYHFS